MSFAIGLNAALNSGWDTWNKLGAFRQGMARAQANDAVDANNKAADAQLKAYGEAAQQAQAGNNRDAALATFGGKDWQNMSDEQKNNILGELESRGLYNSSTGQYDAAGVSKLYGGQQAQPAQQAIPQGAGAAPDDDEAGAAGTAIPPSAQQTAPSWQQDISNNARTYGQAAFQDNQAIQKDLVDSTRRRMETLGDDNAKAMRYYNTWYNPDALDKEDEYKLNQGFKLLGRAVTNGDSSAQQLLMASYNANNPDAQIVPNKDGSYNIVNAQGQVIQQNYKPTSSDYGRAMTQLYNNFMLMRTLNMDKFLDNSLKQAQVDNTQALTTQNQAKAKYAYSNAALDNQAKGLANQGAVYDNLKKASDAKYADVKNDADVRQKQATALHLNTQTAYIPKRFNLDTAKFGEQVRHDHAAEGLSAAKIRASSGAAGGVSFGDLDSDGGQVMLLGGHNGKGGKAVGIVRNNIVYALNDRDGSIQANIARMAMMSGIKGVTGAAFSPYLGTYVAMNGNQPVPDAKGKPIVLGRTPGEAERVLASMKPAVSGGKPGRARTSGRSGNRAIPTEDY